MSGVRIVGIDHVQLSMPVGGEPVARAFYVDILGMREVEKPSALAGRGGCWFVAPTGDVALHLGVETPFHAARKAHPGLLVDDLAVARTSLATVGIEVVEDDSELPIRRGYVHDPFGNRIELIDAADAGFTAPR